MLKLYSQFKLYDKDYQFVRQTRKKRSHSFVQNFLKLLYVVLGDTNSLTGVTDISGASDTISESAANTQFILNSTSAGRGGSVANFTRSVSEGVNAADVGIVLGTGTTAVTPTDYQLATRIADGTTANTLEYFPSSGTGLTVSNPTGSFTLERLFRNSSGGTITVNEMGLYVLGDFPNSPPVNSFCVIRDLVSPGFAIADGEYARVVYTLTITV